MKRRVPAWVWISPGYDSAHMEVSTRRPRYGRAFKVAMSEALWTEYQASLAACSKVHGILEDLYNQARSGAGTEVKQ